MKNGNVFPSSKYVMRDLLPFATIAGISGIGLAAYHFTYDHHKTQRYLGLHHPPAYHVHRLSYMLLWTAFLVNARFCAGAAMSLFIRAKP
jgi:hypothetical protein